MPPNRGRRTLAKPVTNVETPVVNRPQGIANLTPTEFSPVQEGASSRQTSRHSSQEETRGGDLHDQEVESEQDENDDEQQDAESENEQDYDKQQDVQSEHEQNDVGEQDDSQSKNAEKKKRKKGRRFPINADYKIYIHRVLRQVDPNLTISKTAIQIMNDLLKDVEIRLSEEASTLNKKAKKATLGAWEFQAATRLIFRGQIGHVAVSQGAKAVTRFEKATAKKAII